MKVKYKLPLVIVLLSVLPILLVSLVGVYLIDDMSKRDFNMIIKNQSKASTKHITDFYFEQENAIRYASRIDIYKSFVYADYTNNTDLKNSLYNQVRHFQVLAKNNNDSVNQSYIVNLLGSVLVSSDDERLDTNMSYIKALARCIKEKNVSFEIVYDDSGNKFFYMFYPIFDNDEQNVFGVLVREVNIEYISNYIRDLRIGISGYQYIFDSNGNVFSHFYTNRATPTDMEDSSLDELLTLKDSIKNDKLTAPSGFFDYTLSSNKMLAYYEQIPATSWVMVSTVPYKELTQSTTAMRYALLLASTIVIILASFVGLKIALFFTGSLNGIIKRVMLIANGHFDLDTPPKTNDEFDILHDNITTMAYRLKASYKKLSDSAKIDVLTGLYNRSALYEVMDNNFNSKLNQAAMLLDLDGFKAVNDTLGHDYGDDVLISVSNVLRKLESNDIVVSRLGGDEFFIFIIYFSSQDEVIALTKNLLSDICNIKEAMGKPINISASIGIAFSDDNTPDKSCLIKKADLAMYTIKKTGKSNYFIFNEQEKC